MQRGHLLDGMEVGESQRGSGENGMGGRGALMWTSKWWHGHPRGDLMVSTGDVQL